MRRAAVLLVLLTVLASACGSTTPTPSPSPDPTPAPTVPPSIEDPGDTAWQRALAAVGEDGTFTKDQSLTLFATAFGPLPGVDVQQDLAGVHDRTIAIRAVSRYRDELTDEQRTAIDAAIRPPADATIIDIPPAEAAGNARLAIAVTPSTIEAIRSMTSGYRQQIARHLGFDFNGNLVLAIAMAAGPLTGDDPLGEATNYDRATGAPCTITVYTGALEQTMGDLGSVIAHELMHCFQYHAYGSANATGPVPNWIIEGQAQWVGTTIAQPPTLSEGSWSWWLLQPKKALTSRDYDAIGFYAHLAESGVDPWSKFKAMWGAGGSVDAFRAAGADTKRFLQSWASGVTRQKARGRAWDTTGPRIIPDAYPPAPSSIGDGSFLSITRPAFTNEVHELNLDADLVHISFSGDARLHDGAFETTQLEDVWFCVAGHDCSRTCPDGTRPPATSGTIRSGALLATTGGIDGATGSVSAENWECELPEGKALGDVHLVGIDGHPYDFQAVGEFVMARPADASFEAQLRLEPYGASKHISIATGLAVRAGGRRVVVTQQDGALRLAVDGQETPPSQPADLGGGLRVRPADDGLHLDLADGTQLSVLDIEQYGLNVILRPSPGALAGLVGLMGPTPRGSDLPALPDGSALPSTVTRAEYLVNTYRTFADAWRVTQATSLFDYGPGTSTETFIDPTFPLSGELRTVDELTAEQRAAGEAACHAITDDILHAMCVYDVAVSGDTGFSDGYEQTITLLEGGDVAGSGELVRVVNTYANESGPVDLDVYVWVSTPYNGAEGQATKVATVPYGGVSEFFDPGIVANNPFNPASWISIQRAGEPLNPHDLNLINLDRDNEPGAIRTLLLYPGDTEQFTIAGGRPAGLSELWEARPAGLPLLAPLADRASLFVDTDPLYEVLPDTKLYAGGGQGCLTDPDFPTVPQLFQGLWNQHPVALPPGDARVTLHDARTADPSPGCATPSMIPPVPVTAAAGDRAFLFVYAAPGDATLKTLLVPFHP